MKAIWNGTVIADSEVTVTWEGHHYFPPGTVFSQFLHLTERLFVSGRAGRATFYDVEVDGVRNHHAAWTYKAPREPAAAVKDHVAFWNGITIAP